jgi:26S proteasome regulatory subunit N1
MANEGERPTSADKGKGKVDEVHDLNNKNTENGEKPADEKKKDEKSQDEELSEEDQQLKSELEMLVERLKVQSFSCPVRITQ